MKPEKIEGQTIQQWAERAKISEKALHDYIAAIRPTPPTTKPSSDARAVALLREGEQGFGRLLIATSDDKAVRDWQKRVRAYLSTLPQPKEEP